MNFEELFMHRCIELASNGLGAVAPNPMVGCVIVYSGKIIGEGFHQRYGHAHAEVNAINEVIRKYGENILSECELYVSLEPCIHIGKTPPCADLIIEKKVPKVIIGCIDSFTAVNCKGIERLCNADIHVQHGILEKECRALNERFFTFHEKKRPYIILKYAQSKDGFIAAANQTENNRWISNEYSRKLVHKWRSEEQAVMIGTNTALQDNPFLTVREWEGKNPIRIVIDRSLKLPRIINIFDNQSRTLVFNEKRIESKDNVEWIALNFETNFLKNLLDNLFQRDIQSVIVEGGTRLLQTFINEGLWDEARIFIGNKWLRSGIPAPVLKGTVIEEQEFLGDQLIILKNN